MPNRQHTFKEGRSARRTSLLLAAAGLVGWVIGLFVDQQRALFSLLTAYAWLATLLLGALAFLMIAFAVRARWPAVLRPLLESIVAVMPLLALFFLPIAIGRSALYPEGHHAIWSSTGFFLIRAVVYLVTWLALTELLRRWSSDLDRAQALSAVGLIALAFTLTFAGFDWLMALTPGMHSSMFGLYLFAGGFVTAFAVLVVLMRRASPLLGELLRPAHYLSMGKLLLAHVVFWAYLAYSQYFIVWIAAIPAETRWWVPRSEGWGGFSLALLAVHFALPFAFLLSRKLKLAPRRLAQVSWWLIAAHYLDVYWLVMPALTPDGPSLHWLDLAALLLVAGAAVSFGLWRANGRSLVPTDDPALAFSARYEGT